MLGQKLTDVRRIESADGHKDGRYEGVWSGYVVRWTTRCGNYEAKSEIGVRGYNVPCVVTVKNGIFYLHEVNVNETVPHWKFGDAESNGRPIPTCSKCGRAVNGDLNKHEEKCWNQGS